MGRISKKTATQEPEPKRAATVDEIRPLVELCRAGRLFDVQAWIAAGKPVNVPPRFDRRSNLKAPLEEAMASGFHSLVQVLLQAGAVGTDGDLNRPLGLALRMRHHDFVTLIVESGFEPADADMTEVFETWDSALMEYFVERGADVETDRPLAWALCHRIQTALSVLKKYRDRFPSFREQANVALRHHCVEGNMKWVSLMLWAGADPYAPGAHRWDDEPDADDPGASAVELAASYGRFEVFDLKGARLDPKHPVTQKVAESLCDGKGLTRLTKLIDAGLPANGTGGTSLVRAVLERLDWGSWWRNLNPSFGDGGHDSHESRERMKTLRLLVERGGRWSPQDAREIGGVRKRLLKMKPEYTAELVLIMTRHRACEKSTVETLLRTPAMKSHVARLESRITKLLDSWE
ncbi:unnamed protein product [Gemmataceae bacterium]|nr:unnamed protein product [Gemmataceae bacterium]VTT98785.1 unnamed protein product [Gemmataceae bacterium]